MSVRLTQGLPSTPSATSTVPTAGSARPLEPTSIASDGYSPELNRAPPDTAPPGGSPVAAGTPTFRVRVIEGQATLVSGSATGQKPRATPAEAAALGRLPPAVRQRAESLLASTDSDVRADLSRILGSEGFQRSDAAVQNRALDIVEHGTLLGRAALTEAITTPGFVHVRNDDCLALADKLARIGDSPSLREQALALHLVAESHPEGAIGKRSPSEQGRALTRLAKNDLSEAQLVPPKPGDPPTRADHSLDLVTADTFAMHVEGQTITFRLPQDLDLPLVPTPNQVAAALAAIPRAERLAVREVVMPGTPLSAAPDRKNLAVADSVEGRITVGSWGDTRLSRLVEGKPFVDAADVDETLAHEVGHLLSLGTTGWSSHPTAVLEPLPSPVAFSVRRQPGATTGVLELEGRSLTLGVLEASDAQVAAAAEAIARLPASVRAGLTQVTVARDEDQRPTSTVWGPEGEKSSWVTVFVRSENLAAVPLAQTLISGAAFHDDWSAWGQAMAKDALGVSTQGLTQGPHQDLADSYALYRRVVGTSQEAAVREALPHRFAILDTLVAFWSARP